MTVEVLEKPVVIEAQSTDITILVEANPSLVLLDTEKFDQFYAAVKAETDKLVVNVKTAKGRDEIRAMSSKVTKTKTTISKARLRLTEEWRSQTKVCNEAGKLIDEKLTALAAEVRAPLTEWEVAEEARVDECNATIKFFKDSAIVALGDTADAVRARGDAVYNRVVDPARFLLLEDEAVEAKAAAVGALSIALVRLEKEEADVAELVALRAAKVERDAADAQALADAAAAEVEAERIRVAEEARIEGERQAEVAREEAQRRHDEQILREREEAAQAVRDEEAAKAAELQATRQREHEAVLQAERDRSAEVERLTQVERDRAAAELQAEKDRAAEVERLAAADREAARQAQAEKDRIAQALADEKAEREANQVHRDEVKAKAELAIVGCGASKGVAQKIVLAILAKEIPAVSLAF